MIDEQLARKWFAVFSKDDVDAFAAAFAEDGSFIDPAIGVSRHGRDLVRLHMKRWWDAVPDFKAEIDRIHVAGKTVVIQYNGSGTFNGAPLGPPENPVLPTNKPFAARVVLVLDFNADGKCKTCTEYYDSVLFPMGGKGSYVDHPLGLK